MIILSFSSVYLITMEEIISCPKCHQPITPANYFCPNCGQKLHSPPPSLSVLGLIGHFLKIILLCPFGLYWGYIYLRQPDDKSKIVGLITIAVTIIETLLLLQFSANLYNYLQQQINSQMSSYGLQ